ncbi:MAG: hypothetical protein EOP53_08765 [Sphingobacteriales bacterium]|nr:MAG: hypothetical protein EOP53_08765 [Sphingobacteriales bacterium]
MKKFLLSILTLMYMTVSSGIAMEIHYCMGERAGADLYSTGSDKCGRCGMKEQNKKGCCHDDHKFYKLEDSHKKSANELSFNVGDFCVQQDLPVYNWVIPTAITKTVVHNNSPPGYIPRPARILHGVYRI